MKLFICSVQGIDTSQQIIFPSMLPGKGNLIVDENYGCPSDRC